MAKQTLTPSEQATERSEAQQLAAWANKNSPLAKVATDTAGAVNQNKSSVAPTPNTSGPSSTTPTVPFAQTQQGDADVQSAYQDLVEYGFTDSQASSLLSTFTNDINNGVSSAQAMLNIMQTPVFQQRFPAIQQMQDAGLNPVDPGTYVNFENTVRDMASAAGFPQGAITSADITNMLVNGMTAQDVETRIQQGFQALAAAPPEATALLEQWYGISPNSGALAAWYLNPTQSEPLLMQATEAAQAGAAVQGAGLKPVSQSDLMGLAANNTLSSIQSAVKANADLAPVQTPGLGGETATASSSDILAASLGGIPGGETALQGQERVNNAVAQRNYKLGGGGGFQGQGTREATGEGYASQ